MQKPTLKNKLFTRKQAFTLIELLIVIAIIGILFIVLVSKVDFATDKAKATGVQTDFRSFQVAFDTVAKENSGFNTFGWDTGDTNGDRVRNSYDVGDTNKDGVQDSGETWTGRKEYTETWTGVYTLVKPGTSALDADTVFKLESAINKNLDPKLHITIGADGVITMANGAQDPWKTEYHGNYITNAEADGKDRGAIVMYSNGANQEFGSEHNIANGIVSVSVPGNNKLGSDDYSIVSVYTFVNGYGEVKTTTTGFSNNQTIAGNGTANNIIPQVTKAGLYKTGTNYEEQLYTWDELISNGWLSASGIVNQEYCDKIVGDIILPDSFTEIPADAFKNCTSLTGIELPESVTKINSYAFYKCKSLTYVELKNVITINNHAFSESGIASINITENTTYLGTDAFSFCKSLTTADLSQSGITSTGTRIFVSCTSLTSIKLPPNLTVVETYFAAWCDNLKTIVFSDSVRVINNNAFYASYGVSDVQLNDGLQTIGSSAFFNCSGLYNLTIPNSVTSIGNYAFKGTNLQNLVIPTGTTTINSQLALRNKYMTIHKDVTYIAANAIMSYDIRTITFLGTQEEWNNITKASGWYMTNAGTNSGYSGFDVKCTDGTISYNTKS